MNKNENDMKLKTMCEIFGIKCDLTNCDADMRNNRNMDNAQIIQHKNRDKYLRFFRHNSLSFITFI